MGDRANLANKKVILTSDRLTPDLAETDNLMAHYSDRANNTRVAAEV